MTNDPLATTCPDCGKPGRILSTCECGEFLSATLALDESANYDKAYPGGTCSYVERGWCNFTECVRDGCMGERIRSLSDTHAKLAEVTGMDGMSLDDQLAAVIDNVQAWRAAAESIAKYERIFTQGADALEQCITERDEARAALNQCEGHRATLGETWDPRARLAYVFDRLQDILPCDDDNRPIEAHARKVVAKVAAERAYAEALRAAAERMVQTYRDWMAGCDNGAKTKDVEAAHINLRDTLAQSGHEIGQHDDPLGPLTTEELGEPDKLPQRSHAVGQCPNCNGTGYIDGTRQLRCLTCSGHSQDTGFPNAEQRRYLIELLRAAVCPESRCTDGSIISTGPDPQNDACEWCYQRHVTIEALQEGPAQDSKNG